MDIKILSQKVHIDLQFTQKTNKDLNKEWRKGDRRA
jgi:hypothetical protein